MGLKHYGLTSRHMKTCAGCDEQLPISKFNEDSASPDHCFRCRVSTIRLGFAQGKDHFHGTSLVGGTVASDNRHTISQARSNGYDPVPVSRGPTHGLTANQTNKLKAALGG